MLQRPYVGSYSGEKGHQFLHKPWILELAKTVETFIMVSISEMPTIKYCQHLGSTMDKAREMIPKECRIGDTCFNSLATIGDNLYTRHVKNINHVHKDGKYLLSTIIILGTDFNGGETVFYDVNNMNDIVKRAHVINHSHGRCVIGAFDKNVHEGSIWTGHRAVLSFILHKSTFLHFVHNGTIFYEKYISSKNRNKYIYDDGNAVFPKQQVRKKYNSKYQLTDSNCYYVMKHDHIKDTRLRRKYS